jgi:hypothetical protein
MPADILAHLRYPQMLFGIQAAVYSVYHMTDPQVFYNKEDLWRVPGGMTAADTTSMMAPYYTIMKLTGVGEKEEFILMVPFTPAKKSNMIAWMAARCDDPNYGRLLVFNFPKQKLVYGPQQIESRINQDADISKQLALWNQGGSRVIRGSLLVIPVAQSLLFVQPLYIESKGGGLPELKRVIVAYGNMIAMEENLELSIDRIFGVSSERKQMPMPAGKDTTQTTNTAAIRSLISEARRAFDDGQKAMTNGDWAGYGSAMKRLQELLTKLGDHRI